MIREEKGSTHLLQECECPISCGGTLSLPALGLSYLDNG